MQIHSAHCTLSKTLYVENTLKEKSLQVYMG